MGNVIHTSLSREQCRERLREQTDPWPKWWERLLVSGLTYLYGYGDSYVSRIVGDSFWVTVFRRGNWLRSGPSFYFLEGRFVPEGAQTGVEFAVKSRSAAVIVRMLFVLAWFALAPGAEAVRLLFVCSVVALTLFSVKVIYPALYREDADELLSLAHSLWRQPNQSKQIFRDGG